MLTSRTFTESFKTVAPTPDSDESRLRGPATENTPGIDKDSYTPHPRRSRPARSERPAAHETRGSATKLAELEQRLLAKLIAWLEKDTPEATPPAPPVKATMTVTPCPAPPPEVTPAPSQKEEIAAQPQKTVPEAPADNPVWRFVRTGLNLGLNAGAAMGLGVLGASLFGPVGLALGGIALLGMTVSGKEWIK